MYKELISRLRVCREMCETAKFEEATSLLSEAADAIEELSKVVKHQAEILHRYGGETGIRQSAEMNDSLVRLLQERYRWIPVTERLPQDHERVLVVNDDGKMMVAQRAEDDWWHYYCAYDVDRWWTGENGEVAHWMPLPEPPKEE